MKISFFSCLPVELCGAFVWMVWINLPMSRTTFHEKGGELCSGSVCFPTIMLFKDLPQTCLALLVHLPSTPFSESWLMAGMMLVAIKKIHLCVCACSVVSNSLWPRGLQPTRLLCPWNSPGKNTGVGCHFFLQGIFPTQLSTSHLLCLLHWQADFLHFVLPWKYLKIHVRWQNPTAAYEGDQCWREVEALTWCWSSALLSVTWACSSRLLHKPRKRGGGKEAGLI